MQGRDSRLRETESNSGLGPTFTVTSSVELWTSTRELRNFRGCHPCKLKCRLGILGFERRQQSTVLERPLQLLVQLSFGLRRENLEIFADTIHASINEQLIQIYNSFFDFSLKYRVGIVGLERRRQSTVLDRTLQLLTQMQIRDTRFRETTTKYGLGPTFTVTSSVVLWTSTTELRNFHRRPFKRLWSGHEAKERLYVEEAPTKCGSKGNYNTIELFSTVPQNSSKMALSHILILPCCHSKCSYIVVIHDRSCLEMSEADGVDGGAFCKRGFIHLQFAEKLESPKAERHLGSWTLE
ncbi:hypothetical protein V1477_015617 [Vespula maculifrons]|uniref:Uncharacterized protein n=1 Tax=Vespula maculifrons TaxID=7453 RepID=A0ABD2BED0_VESMC